MLRDSNCHGSRDLFIMNFTRAAPKKHTQNLSGCSFAGCCTLSPAVSYFAPVVNVAPTYGVLRNAVMTGCFTCHSRTVNLHQSLMPASRLFYPTGTGCLSIRTYVKRSFFIQLQANRSQGGMNITTAHLDVQIPTSWASELTRRCRLTSTLTIKSLQSRCSSRIEILVIIRRRCDDF